MYHIVGFTVAIVVSAYCYITINRWIDWSQIGVPISVMVRNSLIWPLYPVAGVVTTRFWTDYPLQSNSGDWSRLYPIRIISSDGNKYSDVSIVGESEVHSIKTGYIYVEVLIDGEVIGTWRLNNLSDVTKV